MNREQYLKELAKLIVESARALQLRGLDSDSDDSLESLIEAFEDDGTVRPNDLEYVAHVLRTVKSYNPEVANDCDRFLEEFYSLYMAKSIGDA